ncbi:MAG: hypothetical protein V1809_13190 [Planctomycetota bacterium]
MPGEIRWFPGVAFLLIAIVVFFAPLSTEVNRIPLVVIASIFFITGVSLILSSMPVSSWQRISVALSGVVVCVGLAILGFWSAFSSHVRLEAGIPLIPERWNQFFGKGLFAFGGVVSSCMAVYLFTKVTRKK